MTPFAILIGLALFALLLRSTGQAGALSARLDQAKADAQQGRAGAQGASAELAKHTTPREVADDLKKGVF